MRGLTILTGMNGMGKSSIIQSLLLLRQSFLSNDLENGLNLRGDLCDLGISGELACQSSNAHDLKIQLEFQNQDSLYYSFAYPDDLMDTLLSADMKNISDKETLKGILCSMKIFNILVLSALDHKKAIREILLWSHQKNKSLR